MERLMFIQPDYEEKKAVFKSIRRKQRKINSDLAQDPAIAIMRRYKDAQRKAALQRARENGLGGW